MYIFSMCMELFMLHNSLNYAHVSGPLLSMESLK